MKRKRNNDRVTLLDLFEEDFTDNTKSGKNVFEYAYTNSEGAAMKNLRNLINDFVTSFTSSNSQAHEFMKSIDTEYFLNRSGYKIVSTLILHLMSQNEDGSYVVPDDKKKYIMNMVAARYYTKWRKLFDTVLLEYNALTPMSIDTSEDTQDTMTTKRTNVNSSNDIINTDASNSNDLARDVTHESHENSSGNGSEVSNGKHNNTTSTWGFNGGDAAAASRPQSGESGNEDETTNTTNSSKYDSNGADHEKTNNNGHSNENTTRNKTENRTEDYTRNNPITRTITKKGNLGNTPSSKLVDMQRETLMWQFLDVVFDDLDSVLTRHAY